ncbi:hypothetical protein RF11_02529 [Thelohanellus kitauei]|uniref:Tc1-like transposase DDE domain-containing protein n=1 Tax=Thelohanellus kitauei TaxID=669202 RepID=A0A0C2IU25_THEKT|nr:hypothetical protein RF11_02529 [Thelohanellus kitauei]
MDNVRFHHSVDIESANISNKNLPPYSPFLNPCEDVFSYTKSHEKRDTQPNGRGDLFTRMRDVSQSVQRHWNAIGAKRIDSRIQLWKSFREICVDASFRNGRASNPEWQFLMGTLYWPQLREHSLRSHGATSRVGFANQCVLRQKHCNGNISINFQ